MITRIDDKKWGLDNKNREFVTNVSQCYYHIDNPAKHIFWCLGNCGTTYASWNHQWIIWHAAGCSHLPSDLRKQAKMHLADRAPLWKLPISDPESSKVHVELEKLDDLTGSRNEKSGRDIAVTKKRKLDDSKMGLFEEAKGLDEKKDSKSWTLQLLSSSVAPVFQHTSLKFQFGKPCSCTQTRATFQQQGQS